MPIQAVLGWNRDRVERGLKKQSQPAMKALGLLPLARGLDEIAERVDALQACIPAATKDGPERRANTRAAVAAASPTSRAPPALQIRPSSNGPFWLTAVPASLRRRPRSRRPSTASSSCSSTAAIVVWKGRRRLAKLPAAVRRLDGFAALKTAHAAAREQHQRFAASLERLMVDGRSLDAAVLRRLMPWPVVRALAERLVWIDGAGRLGLYDGEAGTLVSPEGSVTAAGPLRVVHPVELTPAASFRRGERTQAGAVLEQPFAQLSREVYRLTEREQTIQESDRYAGVLVHTNQVGRLTDDRDWVLDDDMGLTRAFASAGLWATFNCATRASS